MAAGAAIVVGFAGKMVERVAQKMDIAARPSGLGEDFGDGAFKADDELAPTGDAFATCELHAEDAAAALPVSWPQSSSLMALILRVETPCTYISKSAETNAFCRRFTPPFGLPAAGYLASLGSLR